MSREMTLVIVFGGLRLRFEQLVFHKSMRQLNTSLKMDRRKRKLLCAKS